MRIQETRHMKYLGCSAAMIHLPAHAHSHSHPALAPRCAYFVHTWLIPASAAAAACSWRSSKATRLMVVWVTFWDTKLTSLPNVRIMVTFLTTLSRKNYVSTWKQNTALICRSEQSDPSNTTKEVGVSDEISDQRILTACCRFRDGYMWWLVISSLTSSMVSKLVGFDQHRSRKKQSRVW